MRRIVATLAVVGALLFSAGATLADDTDEANKLFVDGSRALILSHSSILPHPSPGVRRTSSFRAAPLQTQLILPCSHAA